ncbi:hypothetical protein TTHERM_000028809 (macronuclear) [Tetrahymena thermophila SB210]|uniref:Uncharacterized protein n=1 Tax=Tetrahymena thermophila (strain SB210) TaxID=312017 RepID=W7X641_TETTS|nr:hypothetical protein TTHERM_000028809 [Tetrahymena thermophila SB210]EWS74835.1 hypothetical protein TTHERM_000028809 [Tetrahymena thermophila SB210]|eukprot:XP_012652548.1 hypothetical protein TTHERM_000028809 [Tetrahymena thermophila SB210]
MTLFVKLVKAQQQKWKRVIKILFNFKKKIVIKQKKYPIKIQKIYKIRQNNNQMKSQFINLSKVMRVRCKIVKVKYQQLQKILIQLSKNLRFYQILQILILIQD